MSTAQGRAAGLPPGVTVNPTTGLISGTPTTPGIFAVTLHATNAEGTGTAPLTIDIELPVPHITSAATANGQVGLAFNYQITATNPPHTAFAATGLPAGLTLNPASGQISGTPTGPAGTADVTLSATNAHGTGPTRTLRMAIASAVHPGFYGNLTTSNQGVPTPAFVAGLTNTLANPQSGSTMVSPGTGGTFGHVFAYPDALPAAVSIMDNTISMNMLAGFTLTVMTLPAPHAVPYKVYSLSNFAPYPSTDPGFTLTIG